jgi:FdhD protein
MSLSLDRLVTRFGLGIAGREVMERAIAIEAPIAFEYNGIAHAVMMASPADLTEFAVGFTLSEGLVTDRGEIEDIALAEVEGGWILRIALSPNRAAPVMERVRLRVAEGSCGLCGVESIEQVLRPLPAVTARISTTRAALSRALAALDAHQPGGRRTGALHAAAFCLPDGTIVRAMEDVGRHNALDKLIGALAIAGVDLREGFLLLSARCSYELVEKAVRAGCPMLVTISAPTSLAVERATQAGLTLLALARPDSVLILNDPHGSISA